MNIIFNSHIKYIFRLFRKSLQLYFYNYSMTYNNVILLNGIECPFNLYVDKAIYNIIILKIIFLLDLCRLSYRCEFHLLLKLYMQQDLTITINGRLFNKHSICWSNMSFLGNDSKKPGWKSSKIKMFEVIY